MVSIFFFFATFTNLELPPFSPKIHIKGARDASISTDLGWLLE